MSDAALIGVFYHQEPLGPACDQEEEERKPNPFSVLRFFADGTVVSSSIATPDLAQDWPAISNWFHERHHDRGTYRLSGESISFTITSQYQSRVMGTVDYFGMVRSGRLLLSWRSHINGVIKNAVEYVELRVA